MVRNLIYRFSRFLGLLILFHFCWVSADLTDAEAGRAGVAGQGESKFSCAIAKSAYGSPGFDEPIKRLRAFRDQVLGGSDLGRCLVRVYYRLSGSLAPHLDVDDLKGRSLKWTIRAFLYLVKYLEVMALGTGLVLIAFGIGKRGIRSTKASSVSFREPQPDS